MHLIAPLAAGLVGCESGTFSIVRRGTSTPASYYTDFEGLTAPIVGTNIALDSRGGGVFYVNELVKVTCKSSLGVTIREFIAGDEATCMDVRSDSFTGTHYQTAAVAAGNPITLKAVLDKWDNSAGADDWKVLFNGSAENIQDVLAELSGLANFTVTAYGAVGDGVADDTSAINAAVADAIAALGGVVYFPPGTYRVTNTVTTSVSVSFVGAEVRNTILQLDHATNQLFSGQMPALVTGMLILCTGAHSGTLMNFTGSSGGQGFVGCRFRNTGDANMGTWISHSNSSDFTVRNCDIYVGAGDTFISATVGIVYMYGCSVFGKTGVASSVFLSAEFARVFGNNINFAGVTSGSHTTFDVNGNFFAVAGNHLSVPPITSVTMLLFDASHASAILFESGNTIRNWDSGIQYTATHKLYSLSSNAVAFSQLGSRGNTHLQLGTALSNTDPIVVPAAESECILVQNSSTDAHSGNVQITVEQAPRGSALELAVWNDTAGAITYQWGTNVAGAGATFSVAANSVRVFRLLSIAAPTACRWFLVADSAGAVTAET